MRFLGIDHGTKRVGLAVGGELGIATPLPALVGLDETALVARIGVVVREQRATELVVGLPLNMDDTAGPAAKRAEAFAALLREQLKLPVHLADERLTSAAAEETVSKKDRRGLRSGGSLDSRAAAVLLQDYLAQRFPPKLPDPGEDFL